MEITDRQTKIKCTHCDGNGWTEEHDPLTEPKYKPYDKVNPEWVGKVVVYKYRGTYHLITDVLGEIKNGEWRNGYIRYTSQSVAISTFFDELLSLEDIFNAFTWADGSPCGELED